MYKGIKVILIGGSPMVGKTSLSMKLASKFEYNCISTDDVGQILRTVTKNHPMDGLDYREYYIKKSLKELISDTTKLHKLAWPAIKLLIESHSTYGSPLLVEGFALYPKLVNSIMNKKMKSIWLIGEKNIFENRLIKENNFYKGASNEEMLISKFCQRSIWHNNKIFKEVIKYKGDYIKVTKDLSKEQILKRVLKVLDKK